MICNNYTYTLYNGLVLIIIPKILIECSNNKLEFYVKGGKASEAYIGNQFRSSDWDLVVRTEDSFNKIKKYILDGVSSIIDKNGLIVQNIILNGLKGIQIGLNNSCDEDLFFVDMFLDSESKLKPTIINGIPYIPIEKLIKDLEVTLKDRTDQYNEKNIDYNEKIKALKDSSGFILTEIKSTYNRIKNLINNGSTKSELLTALEDYQEEIEESLESYAIKIFKIAKEDWTNELNKFEEKLNITKYRVKKLKEINR